MNSSNKKTNLTRLFSKATALHQSNQFDEAAKVYQQILDRQPSHADSLHLLGLIKADQGDLKEGLKLMNQAITHQPNFAAFYLNRGLLHQRFGDNGQAKHDFIHARRLDRHCLPAYLQLADIYAQEDAFDEAIAQLTQAITHDPNHRNAHHNLGNIYLAKEEYQQAIAQYKRVIELDSMCAEAWCNQGVALLALNNRDGAMACYQKAIALKPDYAKAYSNLGLALTDAYQYEAAENAYQKAIRLEPNNAEAYSHLGVSYKDQNRLDEAIACFKKAITSKPDYYEAQFNLAISYLTMGHYEEGWLLYESRFGLKERKKTNVHFSEPEWKGEPLHGKTLLIYVEQGIGDTIQFVRYLSLIQETNIIVECQRELISLLKEQYPTVQWIPRGQPEPAFDYHIAIMSLAKVFNTRIETIPSQKAYLLPPKNHRLNSVLDKDTTRLKIGLVWAGNKQHKNDKNRSVDLEIFSPLLELNNVCFYSFQYGERSYDIKRFHLSEKLTDISNNIHNFSDTAALLAQLDCLITVDTSVAHLAGAMGIKTWLLLPYAADFRWLLSREDTPWYASLRLFRQTKPNCWVEPIEKINKELRVLSTIATGDP